MNRARFARSLAPLALLALSALAPAQTPPQESEVSEDGYPLVDLSELVLDRYVVQHVNADQLLSIGQEMVGRVYVVRHASTEPVWNMRTLGNMIVLYDTKEHVSHARDVLQRLDAAPEGGSRSSHKIVEYRPRFVSLRTAQDAVVNLVELSLVPERGLMVLTDDEEDVDAALALLERLDVAERQVLITCQLVEVGGSEGTPLAKDLEANLLKLLPGSAFAQVGMAMLKTSVVSRNQVSVQIETTGKRYRLAFMPVAFDAATGALTVSGCSLTEEGDTPRVLFQTDTILRGGEYTVLAATGATPRLLVVRVSPQG